MYSNSFRKLENVKNFTAKKYVFAAFRASVEENCVFCEVRALGQEITAMREFVMVFIFFCNNGDLRVLNQLPVNINSPLRSRIKTRKDHWVHSAGNNSYGTPYKCFVIFSHNTSGNLRYNDTQLYCCNLN